jgi:hypothetical protein
MDNREELLLNFFKVMANEQRLKIAVALMTTPAYASDLAKQFGLKDAAVLEHLAALRSLNLVVARTHNQQTVYTFDHKALYALNRTVLSREGQPTPVDNLASEEDRRALRPFFDGERLVTFPENPKKFKLLLTWLITQFDEGVRYTEKQVNEIITRYYDDYATLRRGLIDEQLMERDHGVYWRTSPGS